eukprot:GEZU01022719.1.p1 GENE.GEZU01022719.1~~GEZU01022719.1.p1  ORF type:complete len:385 (-),score=83.18 GEZU01022719.1:564-1718(-)
MDLAGNDEPGLGQKGSNKLTTTTGNPIPLFMATHIPFVFVLASFIHSTTRFVLNLYSIMLTEISPELAVQVLSFLDPCFVASNVFLVNKSWAVLANHAFLWRQFFEDKFGKLDDHFYYNDHNHQGEDEDDDADLSTYTNIWKQRFKKCFLDRCLSTWGPNSARLLDSYFKITDDPVRGECTAELEEDCAYVFLRSTGSLISASAPRSTLTTTTTDNKNIIRGRRHIFRIRIDCCKLGRSDDDDQEDDNHFEVVQHDNNQETTGNDYDPLLQQSIDEIYAQYYGLEDHHSGDPSSSSSYSDFPAEAHYIGPSTYPAYASSNDFFIGVTCADQYEQALREDESKGDDGAIVDHNGTAHWGWWGEFRNVWGFWNNNSIDNCDKRIST